jgi:hypothetical protein
MSDIEKTVDTYLAMWNEADAVRRAELIERAWTSEAHYLDPVVEARGYDGLSDMVERVHEQFPAHRFRRTTAVDSHHGLLRFGWELVDDEGAVELSGLDVAVLADDGRLQRIAGFFDVPAEVAA